MLRPDPKQLRAFQEMRGQTPVVEYLQACMADLKARLVTQNDMDVLRLLQGQARAVEFITDLILSDSTTTSGKR